MAAVAEEFKEQVTVLGRRRSLVSIITRPTTADAIDRPAVVILNTGIIHRVGHHRMYVTLSRTLARRGYTVVRFDFSGIGDSAPSEDRMAPLAACLAEVKEVLDSIAQTHKFTRFVLVGLCSGADHAIMYGSNDPRVVGLVLMDPTLPPTPRYYFHYVTQRLLNPRNWLSVVTGRSGLMRLAATQVRRQVQVKKNASEELTLQNLQFSPQLAQSYRTASMRSVNMLAVFTSVSVRHTYQRQILDAFPEAGAAGRLRLEYFPDSDHLFSTPNARDRLYHVIEDWLESA
jgi:pimeloyl-ACP methyl ester carboxylesterase